MKREDVYLVIDSERDYQEKETENKDRVDIIDSFDMAHAILCMEKFLHSARDNWYKDSPENNYENVTPYLRNICGVAVKMGEKYGMPKRNNK